MKELIKYATSIQRVAFLPLGFVAAIALLLRKNITFQESIILILLTIVVDVYSRSYALGHSDPKQESSDVPKLETAHLGNEVSRRTSKVDC